MREGYRTFPEGVGSSSENNQNSETADFYARSMAWVLNAGSFVALLLPIAIFLLAYEVLAVETPMRRGRGYNTNETVMAWSLPSIGIAVFGFRQLYRQVISGQSAGMRRAGIEIVSFHTEGRITFWAAFIRMVVPIIPAVLIGIVALLTGIAEMLWGSILLWLSFPVSAFWNRHHRGWHDRLAGTILIQCDPGA